MLRHFYKVNKTTQIIFGFIGTIYGSYNIIEYYQKNELNNLLESYNNDVKIVEQIDNLTKQKTLKVDKPLFLIDENKFIKNMCLSSIFYGSVFSFFGTFPLFTVPAIGFFAFYKQYENNKKEYKKE